MVPAEPLVPVSKLRIKFGSQVAHRSFEQPSIIGNCGYQRYVSETNQSAIELQKSGSLSPRAKTSKRGPQELNEGRSKKKQKMDRNVSRQCSLVLRTLMEHPLGWVFKQPVDPIKLNIPDYFSVISKPMDLGTIKSRLEKKIYDCTEDFADDIRLTFSNAMLYNPPSNEVHQMAKTLNEVFVARWKSYEKKWNPEVCETAIGGDLSGLSSDYECNAERSQKKPVTPTLSESSVVKRLKPVVTKVKLLNLDRKSSTNLPPKSSLKGTDNGSRLENGSDGAKPSSSAKCSSWGKLNSNCSNSRIPAHSCSNDVALERFCRVDVSTPPSITDCGGKSTSASQMTKSDPDSDGAVTSRDTESTCPTSQPTILATDAASETGTVVADVQMSPKKALRAAMLKSRFADTILKAKQRTLLDHSKTADPMKMQQEKERLERKHFEEKARIEAEIRAAEAAMRLREELELKRRLESEREAARIALEKIERTVEIEENFKVEKELEMLCGTDLVKQRYRGVGLLQQLGLFMKKDDDDLADETEVILSQDCEEGEIFS